MSKIEIPIGENFIVAESYKADDEFPRELTIYIRNKNGEIIQDICLIRGHFDVKNYNFEMDENSVDCLVWGNEDNEDYTNNFRINIAGDKDNE